MTEASSTSRSATSDSTTSGETLSLERLRRCYEGGVPAVVCTCSLDGVPNITYISRVHQVDADRVAISNQFMSKTARNLAENPVASVLLIDPVTYQEYQLVAVHERTERRGPVFERLRHDVDQLAEEMGLRSIFKLRAADIFRVTSIERIGIIHPEPEAEHPARTLDALTEFGARIDCATDLDTVVDAAIEGLDRILGYHHVSLLLLDESGTRMYAIASRGFDDENVGAEVALGDGPIGRPLALGTIQRSTGLRQLAKYSRSIRRSFQESGVDPDFVLPIPGLVDADSRIVVPIRNLGQLIGAVVVEHRAVAAFDSGDEQILAAVASMLGGTIDSARQQPPTEPTTDRPPPSASAPVSVSAAISATIAGTTGSAIRFFETDGSVFVDGEYLIKGVAGRILRTLLTEHLATSRCNFTNRELRLDATLDLPGFKDNLESRLVLLKRRLDERSAPCSIVKTGRGRFQLDVDRPIHLEVVADGPTTEADAAPARQPR
jgi:adenylate cyclase